MTPHRDNNHDASQHAPHTANGYLRGLLVVAGLSTLFLIFQGLSARPTGYLHSWNQISALTLVRQLAEAPLSILSPQGSIARVTTPLSPDATHDARFVNFQEFPLYHLTAVLVTRLGVELEVASRLISLFCWGLQWLALARLMREQTPLERTLTHLLYLTSFSILYYGQAIMSDIAMAASGAWAIERAVAWRTRQASGAAIAAMALITCSSLCKSYGLIFALPVSLIIIPSLRSRREIVKLFLTTTLAALPVIGWHLYAALHDGYHETSSHALGTKLSALTSIAFYKSLWRDYTHIVGLIPGVAALVCIAWKRWRKTQAGLAPLWLAPWMLALIPYAIITLDKLTDHEYYLLPFAPPLIAIVAMALADTVALARSSVAAALVIILFITHITLTSRSVLKAQRENPDVPRCAEVVRSVTSSSDTGAFFSDLARYNSLAYYAHRRGYHVEQFSFPATRYRDEGARFIVIAFPPAEQESARQWLRASIPSATTPLASAHDLKDFRGKPRLCEIYTLTVLTPGSPK